MRTIIRSSVKGKKLTSEEVERKRNQVKEEILFSGKDYVEFEAILGSRDEDNDRIEGYCYIIEVIEE